MMVVSNAFRRILSIVLQVASIKVVFGNFTLVPLNDITIFAENLGPARLYHSTWQLYVSIDTAEIENRSQQLESLYNSLTLMCLQQCSEQLEIDILKGRIQRLETQKLLLNKLLGKGKNKRGLINAIGSISKTLFGTLTEDDFGYLTTELDKLYKDNNVLTTAISNQSQIIKTILNSTSYNVNFLIEQSKVNLHNFDTMTKLVNNNTRNLFIANHLTMCAIILQELSEDLQLLIDAINDGKHGIVHPQLLTPETLLNALGEFEEKFDTKYSVPLKEVNFQYIIDISEIGVCIFDGKLLYSVKIPILESEKYQIQHLLPIPQKKGLHFIAPIPRDDYVLINDQKTVYVPTDKDILKDCKRCDETVICKRLHPTYLIAETHTCENQIIRATVKQLDFKICQVSPFKIDFLTYLTLENNQGYILIPEKELSLNVICSTENKDITVSVATLILSDEDCILQSDSIIIKLKKTVKLRKHVMYKKNITVPISSEDLNLLQDQLMPLRKRIDLDNLQESSRTLDEIENSLNKIKATRRTKSWTEKAQSTLGYLGYVSMFIITSFVLYKCGLVELCCKCFPQFCIKICCPTSHVTNNLTPHVVTYVPTAPLQNTNINMSEEGLVEQHLVKLRRKK